MEVPSDWVREGLKELSVVPARVEIPPVTDAHPLQVNPGIGFLGTLEGFGLVRGWPFPDRPFVSARPVLSRRA